MKTIILSLSMLSSFAQAASDSVGVFYRPEKVIVLMNEMGSAPRLKTFIQSVTSEASFTWLSEDESVKIQCAYNSTKASCTFRLLPSSFVAIQEKAASVELSNFPVANTAFRFESSQKDIFELQVSEQTLKILASKK